MGNLPPQGSEIAASTLARQQLGPAICLKRLSHKSSTGECSDVVRPRQAEQFAGRPPRHYSRWEERWLSSPRPIPWTRQNTPLIACQSRWSVRKVEDPVGSTRRDHVTGHGQQPPHWTRSAAIQLGEAPSDSRPFPFPNAPCAWTQGVNPIVAPLGGVSRNPIGCEGNRPANAVAYPVVLARTRSISSQPRSATAVLRFALRSVFYGCQCCNAICLDRDEPVESDNLEDVLNVWLEGADVEAAAFFPELLPQT